MITTSSLTTVSATVSWTQGSFSFTPVSYNVTLTRVTGSSQVLCTKVMDSRPSVTTMPTISSMEFIGLHEFSVYRIKVTARFSAFDLSPASPATMEFTTLSSGMYVVLTNKL